MDLDGLKGFLFSLEKRGWEIFGTACKQSNPKGKRKDNRAFSTNESTQMIDFVRVLSIQCPRRLQELSVHPYFFSFSFSTLFLISSARRVASLPS